MPEWVEQVVDLPNERLDLTAYDFRSVTERKDFPRKYPCLPDDEDAISSTDPNFPCQRGCGNERQFFYIVEAGDQIPLQFQVEDFFNTDPNNPAIGWRTSAPGAYWLGVALMNMDGEVMWEGTTIQVASSFHVGYGEFGGYQNLTLNITGIINTLADTDFAGTECFYLRIQVFTSVGSFITVNADHEPEVAVSPGYTYIDFAGSGLVLQWTGSEWVEVGPPHAFAVYYVQDSGAYYSHDVGGWLGLAEPPDPSELGETGFDYIYTMPFRIRHCNENIVEFASLQSGRDCIGYIHDVAENAVGYNPTTFQHFFKVKGGVEGDSLPIGRELTENGRLLSATIDRTARLRTHGLPESVVRRVQVVVAEEVYAINGEAWDEVEALRKNNDGGLFWWLNSLLSKEDCERKARC